MNGTTVNLRQLVRFGMAGALNTCFGYLAFASLLWGTGIKEVAVVFGTFAGILFNFNTYKVVFVAQGMSRLPRFLAFYATMPCSNIVLLHVLTATGLSPYVGQAMIIALVAPISFLTLRFWVFADALELKP
ncbi:GtrA family protein [Sphingomonas piscis]|uniref:GtrA family protein n=1 Tax=Sphingomonas piscis TaxID=2714943 RepID=A0A6G7YRV2_9SPHN|nr:GtrA family protein [Sphingomonas piscis]QIK79462.1 GtrA family protein [Sphingomonas piscis]